MAFSSILTDESGVSLDAESGDFLLTEGVYVLVTGAVTAPDRYGIDLCVDWIRKGECVGGQLTGVKRHLEVGQWQLDAAVSSAELQTGVNLEDVNTVRLVRNNDTVVLSGRVGPIGGQGGGLQIVSAAGGDRFTLSGPDEFDLLASRLAWPDPATVPPWATSHDTRSGMASTVAAAYVTANLGSGAITARQIPGVTVVDGMAGLSGVWTARLQPLDKLISRICRDGGITCRITVSTAGAITVTFTSGRDRSETVILSDQGDLVNNNRRAVPAAATFVIAGGTGTLTSRLFATSGTATGLARREVFNDQSSLVNATEVQQAAKTTAGLGAAAWSVESEIAVTVAQRLRYLDEYDVGDLIAVEIDDIRYTVPVEAVRFDIGATRQTVTPVLGVAAPNLLSGLLRDIADLQSKPTNQIA